MRPTWLSLAALPLAGALSVGQVPDGLKQDYARSLPLDHDDPDYSNTLAEAVGPESRGFKPCTPDEWTMPSFEDAKEETLMAPPWVIIRGGTFPSGVKLQEESFCSVRKHVIQPMMAAHALRSVHVHLCVRPHEANTRILNHAEQLFGVQRGDVSLREISKEQEPMQQGQYLSCLADVPRRARFALIMRPDLVFTEHLVFRGPLSPNRFYFQWNLFQQCRKNEVPDQIHVVGGNLLDQFTKAMDITIKADTSRQEAYGKNYNSSQTIGYWDDFHLLYMFVRAQFGEERLGYLNYYPTENCIYHDGEKKLHKLGYCRQRGNGVPRRPQAPAGSQEANPAGGNTNPLFVYTRHVANESVSACDGGDFNIRKPWMEG